MQRTLNPSQLQELDARIKTANSSGALLLAHLPDHFLQGRDKDDNSLLHIIFLINKNDEPLPYASTANLTELIMDYMNEQDMPHFPIIHQIEAPQWPTIRKGFQDAIAATP